MSLSTSTEPASSENEQNLEEKNMPSSETTLASSDQLVLPKLPIESLEKPKNYQKKMVRLNLK